MKQPTLYIPKGNIKKSNKIKKDVDKVSKICYYPIVARARKRKLKSKSETGIKMGWRYLDNYPLGKRNFEINFKMEN